MDSPNQLGSSLYTRPGFTGYHDGSLRGNKGGRVSKNGRGPVEEKDRRQMSYKWRV